MIQFSTKIKVRYSETDQMGFVYYGNYAQYLEIGRVETLRSKGISYRSLEESGYALPVKEMKISYKKAAKYDDELIVTTTINEKPSNRITFKYIIYRDKDELVVAETTLFFMNKDGRACRPPKEFVDQMEPFFN